MPDLILGIDIGTASTKVIAFDLGGAEVAYSGRPYPLQTPQPAWVEQDSEQVWQGLLDALREIAERTSGNRILSLALAAQAGSIIPCDEAGDPVHPMITWLDRRSDAVVAGWQRDGTASRIRELSGWHPFPGLPLPVIAWLAAKRPDVHARARRYLGPADFLIHRLTGKFATDLSAACEMLLVDAATGEWNGELCAVGGVDPKMQAELGWAGRVIGTITPEVAAATGLPAETRVVAGGGDQPCACLGMGMLEPGRVALATGTAWVITGITSSARLADAPPTMDLSFHAAPQRWTVSQFLGGFGATVDWWMQQAWQPADPAQAQPIKELYGHLDAALNESAPGSQGLLFTPLGGPSQMSGAPPGGAFAGLQLVHTRADMARAILEGCAFEVRWALDQLSNSGLATTELWIAGGASASPVWPQILADITRVPIVLADYANWAALGGAALAGWGVGAFQTLEEAVRRLQPPIRRLAPDASLASLYRSRYEAYRRVATALTDCGVIP
jgi:xylulokinase